MNKALIFAVATVLTAVVIPTHAQTYRWKDANGKIVISDKPPPASIKDTRAIGVRQPSVVHGKPEEAATDKATTEIPKAADAPKTMAEKEAEFKKRQQEARDKAAKETQDASFAKERKDACEQAKRNLNAIESNQPIAQFNDKGERQILDDSQRQQERERTLRIMQEACK